jgi:polar amino acid transport system substrate-binding protein
MHDRAAVLRELAPTGSLRVAVAVGPPGSAFWATSDAATGEPRGVTVDLGLALAQKLGVRGDIITYKSSGEIMDACASGAWDITFIPVDDERKRSVDFTTNYALGESTFLVAPGSAIMWLGDVDRADVRVVGVENTTTIRAARRTLKNATVSGAPGAADTLALLRVGKVDAIALGRDTLQVFAADLPGARVLDGYFWAVGVAAALPKQRPAGLAYASEFVETAKTDGTLRRALDNAGMRGAQIAPVGSRS